MENTQRKHKVVGEQSSRPFALDITTSELSVSSLCSGFSGGQGSRRNYHKAPSNRPKLYFGFFSSDFVPIRGFCGKEDVKFLLAVVAA